MGTYTRTQWATSLLQQLGNSNPSQGTIDFVINWTTAENGSTQSGWNLLNTSYHLNGVDNPVPGNNPAHNADVQLYQSFADGITANADTLKNGRYPALYAALLANDTNALDSGNSLIQSEMGTWGTGWKSWYANAPSSAILAQQEPGDMLNLAQPGSVVGNVVQTVQDTTQLLANLGSAWALLSSPGVWIKVGLFVAALGLLIAGVIVVDTGGQPQ